MRILFSFKYGYGIVDIGRLGFRVGGNTLLQKSIRKPVLVSALILLTVLLTGCSVDGIATIPTEELVNRGFWNRFIVYPMALSLDFFAGLLMNQYGLSILVMTIIIRFLILPLTLKQYRSSRALQALQPQLQKLREKYKNDQQKFNQELMKLYQEHNINPLAGCLPVLIQMPILLALYNAIMYNPAIRGEHSKFLWMDLSQPDNLYILPVLAALTTYIQQKMVMSQSGQNNPMQGIMIIFPILIFVMSISFPSALPLYWVYSNLFTLVQTYFIYGIGKNKGGQVKGGKA